jgi:beta-lactamase class A
MNLDRFLEIESRYEGNLHICAMELGTGLTWKLRENERVSTASTIKLPILMHAAMCVEEGTLRWDDELMLETEDVVAGMGVLRHMKTPRCLTLHDACYLMTAISDNTATNMVIDKVGIEAVNERIRGFGLRDTLLNRKAFSPDTEASRQFGLGMSTASDMMRLMQIIYAPETIPEGDTPASAGIGFGDGSTDSANQTTNVGNKVDTTGIGNKNSDTDIRSVNGGDFESGNSDIQFPGPVANGVIRAMLALQQDLVGVARVVPPGWQYAGKTGRISTTRGEAAMVGAPDGRTWLIGIFCFGLKTENWTIQNEGLLAIAEATEVILAEG